jgi:hypothetical protein
MWIMYGVLRFLGRSGVMVSKNDGSRPEQAARFLRMLRFEVAPNRTLIVSDENRLSGEGGFEKTVERVAGIGNSSPSMIGTSSRRDQ